MIRALSTAASGLQAQQENIERIANDLANANTDGYKRTTVEFQDLMYETVKAPGEQLGAGTESPVGVQKGMGVKVGAAHKIFRQGPSKMTYHPFDLMIQGPGFFPILMPNGETLYTRTGAFKLNNQGNLQLAHGGRLIPQVVIPRNAVKVGVTPGGEMQATLPDQSVIVIGQIQLASFQNEQGLSAEGSGMYAATPASGAPLDIIPGENGIGTINQGALEGSNVNVPDSMVDMIQTQRTYEMGTKVMGIADRMLEATVNIK